MLPQHQETLLWKPFYRSSHHEKTHSNGAADDNVLHIGDPMAAALKNHKNQQRILRENYIKVMTSYVAN